jgi:adenylate kinase
MKIIMLGPPGSGKGTYSKRMSPELGIPHISTGDLCRAEAASGSALGKQIKAVMDKGGMISDEMMVDMLKKRLAQPDAKKGYILDGFPRNIKQAEMLEKITGVDMVLNIDMPDSILVRKIAGRRVCRKCGNIYNIADIHEGKIHMPPLSPKVPGKCDKCGGELYQRDDDKEAIVKDRLVVYTKQTQPLIDHYKKKGLVRNLDVIGDPDIMMPIIMKTIRKA